MGAGKLASQAGHAYVEALLQASQDRFSAYRAGGLGTKVCLGAEHLGELLLTQQKCIKAGIPCALITDSGCPDFFGGVPTVTALGVGPAKKHEVKKILGRFRLVA